MTSKLYLTKPRNGYYYIGFFVGNNHKWRTTKCTTKSDALQILRNFEGTKKELERTPLLIYQNNKLFVNLYPSTTKRVFVGKDEEGEYYIFRFDGKYVSVFKRKYDI